MPIGKQLSKESFGYVALTSHETKVDGRRMDYVVRWRDPLTKKDIKKALKVANKDEARSEARKLNEALKTERARLHQMPVAAISHIATAPELREAVKEAIEARNARKAMTADHVYNLNRYGEKFFAFMESRFPAVKQWRELRRTPHVSQYVAQLKADGLKPVSIRHCLEVISLTANYFADEYEEMGYRSLRVLKLAPELEKPAKNYMTAEQLERAIEISREIESPAAELSFLLGGWCGLNLREIARLTATDFDFTAKLLTVQKSKNVYRSRTIPVPDFVLEAVRLHLQTQTVKDVAGSLFVRESGIPAENRYLARPMDVVLHRMGIRYATAEAAKAAKAAKPVVEFPKDGKAQTVIVPKDVRKTFINLARSAGCERETLRRYIGHVPSDVMSEHYEDFTIEKFKTEIVSKIEALRNETRSKVGNFLETSKSESSAIAR